MKIVDGVQLHLIKSNKYKTNHITFRFSGEYSKKTISRRVLIAQILETANADYPTAQLFREKLSNLYGASLSTSVSTKGLVHMIDIDITFLRDKYTLSGEKILDEIILFLKSMLFAPLLSVAQYQPKFFDVEKTNLINYLDADKEDSFYYSSLAFKKYFYYNESLKVSKYSKSDLVQLENAFTVYQEFQKILREDRIDIFVLGEFDEYRTLQLFHQFPFEPRKKDLHFFYQQEVSNIVNQIIEKKDINQSIIQLAYHHPIIYGSKEHFSLIVLNGILGSFSHSKLFTNVREKEGLAYSIGSRFDIYTGLLDIYAGIDIKNRSKMVQLISKEINDLRMGRFSADILKKTKQMLITNALLAEDQPKVLIDLAYNESYLPHSNTLSTWIDKIDNICKIDVMRVANLLKLQVVYSLESEDE